MKRTAAALAAGFVIACASWTLAETVETHKVFRPQEIKWGSGPAGLPAGTELAILFGDPAKPGMFAMRIKMPKDYKAPPHMHSAAELLTLISGQLGLGLGQSADRSSVEKLTAGSFSSMPQGVVHYLFVNEDLIVQVEGMGPWGVEYPNPKDDPRLNRTGEASQSAHNPSQRHSAD